MKQALSASAGEKVNQYNFSGDQLRKKKKKRAIKIPFFRNLSYGKIINEHQDLSTRIFHHRITYYVQKIRTKTI